MSQKEIENRKEEKAKEAALKKAKEEAERRKSKSCYKVTLPSQCDYSKLKSIHSN